MLPSSRKITRAELAWELVSLFDELGVDQINEVLAKNVPLETLDFIASYAEDFSDAQAVAAKTRKAIPNLLLVGYLLRVLEERLISDGSSLDA